MNNAEAGSSSDEEEPEEDKAMDALTAAMLESEAEMTDSPPAISPEKQRELDIIAEVARRREAKNSAAATQRKSDAIFDKFDIDRDGLLNYRELSALGRATGGDLPQPAYVSVCKEIGADPNKGVSRPLLLCIYTDAGLGDVHRDYNLIFGPGG